MLFKLSNLNSNLALTLGYLNPALNNSALEFEYLHRKSRCEMLIGGDDISNDLITLRTCFSMFVYIRARFRFALIGSNLTDFSPN